MKKLRVGLIGLGGRGAGLYRVALRKRKYVDYVAVCDNYKDKAEKVGQSMVNEGRPQPAVYTDYKKCIDEMNLDAVVVATSWQQHIEVSIYAMEKGVAVACEVGGAYSIESLWELVRTYERTKTPIMMMENCNYGRNELLALEMKRKGLLGKIVHCQGGYRHDLRSEVATGVECRQYRLNQYIHRNTENYPTHEIGPIAKLLDINAGNRFVSIVSVGCKPQGMKEYVKNKNIEHLKDVEFNQSDVVTSIIKCQNGETITIFLDTCNPRYYSRGFLVEGTKGLINEDNRSVFLEDDFREEQWEWKDNFNNIDKFYEKYDHPNWIDYHPGIDGHGGMDELVFDGFFDALVHKKPMPIDVYDMATWMSISVLAEESMLTGRAVSFPDFTDGKWITNENTFGFGKTEQVEYDEEKEEIINA